MIILCKALWEMLAVRSGYSLEEFAVQRTRSAGVGGVRRQGSGQGVITCVYIRHAADGLKEGDFCQLKAERQFLKRKCHE